MKKLTKLDAFIGKEIKSSKKIVGAKQCGGTTSSFTCSTGCDSGSCKADSCGDWKDENCC